MSDDDWDAGFAKSLMVFLNGHGLPELDARGERIVDDSFLFCFNAHHEQLEFTLPDPSYGLRWQVLLDTAVPVVEEGSDEDRTVKAGAVLGVAARTVVLLQRVD